MALENRSATPGAGLRGQRHITIGATLRIRLLPTVFDEEALFRPRVADAWLRQVFLDDHIHASPCQPTPLAPSPEALVPADFGVMADRANGPGVPADSAAMLAAAVYAAPGVQRTVSAAG